MVLVCRDAVQQQLEPLYPSGPDVVEKRSGDPFRCGQFVEKGRAGRGDFDLGLEPSVAPADALVPFEAQRVECRPARFIRCGEEFGQTTGPRLRVGQHEACAAVVVESGENLPDVPEVAEREVAAAPPRLEGAGVAARAQGPVVEECPEIDILAGRDAVGAACGPHREVEFAPAVALVAEVDAENRGSSGEFLQVTAQQTRGGCAVAEAFGRHEAVGGAAAKKGPQPGDLTGCARIEDFASLVKGAGYLPEGSGGVALCVFGFGECSELLLACGAAVPDCPPPGRIGVESSTEDKASLAEREAGQRQEDAARRTAGTGGCIVVPRGPHFRRRVFGRGVAHRADALAEAAAGAGVGLDSGVEEPLGILLHSDAAGRATLGADTAAAALFFFVQEDHFV